MKTHINDRPLNELLDAAKAAYDKLDLRYLPEVIRDEQNAFSIADKTRHHVVMLGEDAFWVVCMADAARLERAGFEWAPRPN